MKKIYWVLPVLIVLLPFLFLVWYQFYLDNSRLVIDQAIITKDVEKDLVDVLEDDKHSNDMIEKYQKADEALKYFFATVSIDNPSYFIEGFVPQVIFHDLSNREGKSKSELIQSIKMRISRNQSIQEIKILHKQELEVSHKVKYEILIRYKDKKKANIQMELLSSQMDQHDNKQIYLVNTSAWLLLKQIEENLKE